MSVLIKGMKMPKSCDRCFVYKSICPATMKRNKALGDDVVPKDHRHADCPLIELPEKHGRLIDADRLIASLKEIMTEEQLHFAELAYITGTPTVIEAEDGT